MKLTYILTTRERPDDIVKTVQDILPNVELADTRLLICADLDDTPTIAALEAMPADERVVVSVRPREDSRGEKCDRALTEAPADVYLVGHDCAPILTPGFDRMIVETAELFPDGIGVVNTPHHNMSFPSFQAPTAKLVEMIGHIYNHEYPFWFVDHELDDIARMIGRNPYVDVDVQVAERRPGKTLRLRELPFWTTYFDAMTLERRAKAMRIVCSDDFRAPEWQKSLLQQSYHPIEARSLWLNHNVRESALAIEAARGDNRDPDPGYVRLKDAAVRKLEAMRAELERMAA